MDNTTQATVVAVVLFFIGLWIVVSAGIVAVWLTEEIRVFGLVMLPAAIVGALQFMYFIWRGRLFDRAGDDQDKQREPA